MTDNVTHPPHYIGVEGLSGEVIEYTRHMSFAQGNAFKYVARAGSKDDITQDLAKAVWYLRDALDTGKYGNATYAPGFPRIDPNTTHRAKALHYIAWGRLDVALRAIEHFGARITQNRQDTQ